MLRAMSKPIENTQRNLDETLDKGGIVVLDFWASWCAPCRAFAPTFEAAAARHPDVTFGKVDTEAEQGLARDFGISAIPTLAVFRDGIGVSMKAGALNGPALEALLAEVRALDMEAVRQQMANEEPPPELDE